MKKYDCSTCETVDVAEKMFSVIVSGGKSLRIIFACAECAGVARRIKGTLVYPLKGTLEYIRLLAAESSVGNTPTVGGTNLPPRGKSRKEISGEVWRKYMATRPARR